jgi:hypothetical protein
MDVIDKKMNMIDIDINNILMIMKYSIKIKK